MTGVAAPITSVTELSPALVTHTLPEASMLIDDAVGVEVLYPLLGETAAPVEPTTETVLLPFVIQTRPEPSIASAVGAVMPAPV